MNNNDSVLDAIDKAKWNDSDIHGLWLCDGDVACQAMRSVSNQIEAIRTVYLASKQANDDAHATDRQRIAELESHVERLKQRINLLKLRLRNTLDAAHRIVGEKDKHITELEEQVESAYKQGYDDGHSKGFTEGYHEKEQELT